MAEIKELSDKFEVLKPPSTTGTDDGRISQRDILPTAIKERLLDVLYAKLSYIPGEIWLQAQPQWDNAWTVNNTYTTVVGSGTNIDFDKYEDLDYYFQINGKTDAGTGYFQVYNETTSTAIADSELSTTSTSIVTMKTGILIQPSGINKIAVRHKIVGGDGATEYVNSVMSAHIFAFVLT